MRTSSRTPMRDLLALARRFSRSSRPNRHTAEVRYPEAMIIAVHVTLHSFIYSSGFRIKYGMPPLFSLLILKTKGHSARPNRHTAGMRDLLALVRRFSRSSRPKRHTAEMRYPVAQDNGIRPNRHTAEMRYPEAMIIAVHVTLHSFIHSSGFRIKYGMTSLFSSLILKAKDYSVRLNRHTAGMRYPVA